MYNIPYDVATAGGGGLGALGNVAGKAAPQIAAALPHMTAAAGLSTVVIAGIKVNASVGEVKSALNAAGYPGKPISNPSGTESGTLHNVSGMKMDVRVMNGGPHHGPRAVASREGTA